MAMVVAIRVSDLIQVSNSTIHSLRGANLGQIYVAQKPQLQAGKRCVVISPDLGILPA
jgi:hypothetical protein